MIKSLATMGLIAMTLAATRASAQMTVNCSDAQFDHISAAQVYAGLELLAASSYIGTLKEGTGDPTRFDHWYGSHEYDVLNTIDLLLLTVYAGIREVTYNCHCDDDFNDAYAYVYPNDRTYQVHVCSSFFEDSNFEYGAIGTTLHEISHFAGTIDCMDPDLSCSDSDSVPSTPHEAHEFAQNDPQTVRWNAYNFENFVTEGGM